MSAKLSRRNLVLGGVLLATLAISAWTLLSGSDEALVEPVARSVKGAAAGPSIARLAQSAAATGAPTGELALGQRPAAPTDASNLFSAYSYQAQAPATVAQAPQKPHAPPLPFTYTGHLEIDGLATYLLMQGDAPLSVVVGAKVGDFTLVEARDGALLFLHEPTGERVLMPTAAAAK